MFYVPDAGLAIQVAHSITERARKREVQSLAKLSRVQDDIRRLVIVTKEEQETIAVDGTSIEVTSAWRFLLQLTEPGALATRYALRPSRHVSVLSADVRTPYAPTAPGGRHHPSAAG